MPKLSQVNLKILLAIGQQATCGLIQTPRLPKAISNPQQQWCDIRLTDYFLTDIVRVVPRLAFVFLERMMLSLLVLVREKKFAIVLHASLTIMKPFQIPIPSNLNSLSHVSPFGEFGLPSFLMFSTKSPGIMSTPTAGDLHVVGVAYSRCYHHLCQPMARTSSMEKYAMENMFANYTGTPLGDMLSTPSLAQPSASTAALHANWLQQQQQLQQPLRTTATDDNRITLPDVGDIMSSTNTQSNRSRTRSLKVSTSEAHASIPNPTSPDMAAAAGALSSLSDANQLDL